MGGLSAMSRGTADDAVDAADPDRRRAARIATLVAIPAALLAGFISLWATGVFSRPDTGPVAMPERELSAEATGICQAVIANLPETVLDAQRRPVTAGAEQNAAYGDPPLTLACGTEQPTVELTATVFGLSGVCWYAEEAAGETVWTTVDRVVPVTVTVPGPAEGASQSVIAFSDAIRRHDPRSETAPTGCP